MINCLTATLQLKMDDDERMEFLKEKDELEKKNRKRHKKESKEKSKKSKESKSDECVERMKKEMDEMKKKIDELEKIGKLDKIYALDFDVHEYLSKGFIESAKWISNTIAVNMKERMKSDSIRWEMFAKNVTRILYQSKYQVW